MKHGHRFLIGALVVVALAVGPVHPVAAAIQIDIVGPAGSGAFGTSVTVLPSGNIVVTDPYYDDGATEDVGAVNLYDGATGALISTLTGSTAGDQVGCGSYDCRFSVTVLSNGNYVVRSGNWDNGEIVDAGAVTWGNGTTGISGVVSAANSLVGSTAGDRVGDSGFPWVTALSNGNYVVGSPYWDNGGTADAGAVTWGNGTTGTSGAVSAANSLVGSTANDRLGSTSGALTALSSGNYLVGSPYWDNGAAADAGAATWGDGTTGITGPVSAVNSLVGSTAGDMVGNWDGVKQLSNGNYLVGSPDWDNGAIVDAGAVTWGNGSTGITGPVSAANSLMGSTAGDQVGFDDYTYDACLTALSNGNYVVGSPYWDNGAVSNTGAATWGNGATGTKGVVSAANSLVGSTAGDQVGRVNGVTALSNGNYVVSSNYWDNGPIVNAGAVTWGNGTTGTTGPVSVANSLVGSTAGDSVGSGYPGGWALSNGNYVVVSTYWDNGAVINAGAVTWGNGTTGTTGAVSAANSLVGSTADDQLGSWGVTPLANGNYVVRSPVWDNGTVVDAGAATWGNGTTGTSGPVSTANSLVGSTYDDEVGMYVAALSNGNFVVSSYYWDNGGIVDAGHATWGNGTTGIAGPVSAANSLVGSTANDSIGSPWGVWALSNGNYVVPIERWDNGAVVDAGALTWGNGAAGITGEVSAANSLVGSTAYDEVGGTGGSGPSREMLGNGNYVLRSAYWDNGAIVDAGAVTWVNGTGGTTGLITADNSVLGTAENGGGSMRWAYDSVNRQLVVGRPADNIVTLFRLPTLDYSVFLPVILKSAP
jgi:hypothetical protein